MSYESFVRQSPARADELIGESCSPDERHQGSGTHIDDFLAANLRCGGVNHVHYPAAILGGFGLIALSAGLGFLALFPENGTALDLMWRMALCGLGFGFFQAPNNRTMMSSAPRARSGAAAGLLSTVRSLGHASGAALVAVLFSTHREGGAQIALIVAAVMAAIAALLSFSRLRTTRPGPG